MGFGLVGARRPLVVTASISVPIFITVVLKLELFDPALDTPSIRVRDRARTRSA